MRLSSVRIKNYRSIENVVVEFEPRCRILVGLNEAGKSNVLAALALLDSASIPSEADVREPVDDEAQDFESSVAFTFKFEPKEREAIVQSFLSHVNGNASELITRNGTSIPTAYISGLFSEGLYEINVRKKTRSARYWNFGKQFLLANGWLKLKALAPAGGTLKTTAGKVIKTDIEAIVHESSLDKEARELFIAATLEDVFSLLGKKITAHVNSALPSCLYWTYSERFLLPGRIQLSTFAEDPGSCEPLKQMFALAGYFDASEAISEAEAKPNGMRNLLNRVAVATTKHIGVVWKEAKHLEFSLNKDGEFIDASVKDAHNFYELSRRSDGFKRFISFVILVSAKAKTNSLVNTLYLHDEPDLGIHPSGIPYLLNELIKISRTNYVLISTHSIFMVDKERVDRHLIVKKTREKTTLHSITSSNVRDEEVVYNALGFSLFQNIKRKNLIFEGWRDKHLYKIFSNGAFAKRNGLRLNEEYGLCHAKGVKDIDRVSEMISLYGADSVALTDSDDPAKQARVRSRIVTPNYPWFFYDDLSDGIAITAEDFILPSYCLRQLSQVLAEYPQVPSIPDGILEGELGKIAYVKAWLADKVEGKDLLQQIMNVWKTKIFDDLTAANIDDRYQSVASGINEKMRMLGQPADQLITG